MTTFISGPMTGYEDFNYPLFHAAGRQLEARRELFFSPAHHWTGRELEQPEPDEAMSWEYYMKRSLKMLLECDSILLLPGWEYSRGAIIEKNLAKDLGMKITYYDGGNNELN